MQDEAATGLRERKKAATRLAIERAAVDIAYDQGYEAATAEAIAARAGVSLRTFFNYFSSKDVAIAGEGPTVIEEERARRVLEEAGSDTLKGIARVVEVSVTEQGQDPELKRRRRRLINAYPPLMHLHFTEFARFDTQLVHVVAGHLREHPSLRRVATRLTVEDEARLAVAMVSATVRYHTLRSIAEDADVPMSVADIEEIIDLMACIHRSGS
jgi:AcrR family transcriptional regulator